jgi:uncharacterized protein GlcG (DUF336 family)
MTPLTLAQASTIVDAALGRARELETSPMTAVVLDSGGYAVCLKREDNSSLFRAMIAEGKAKGALGMGVSSRALAQRAAAVPAFIQSVTALAGGQLVPVPGGVLIQGSEGAVIGAVGVSGDTPELDEEIAVHGIAAAGLHPVAS